MGKADKWRGSTRINTQWRDNDRSYDAARLIAEEPVSVVIKRPPGGTPLAAQTVRVETIDNVPFERFVKGDGGLVNGLRVLVIGYKNHPSIADTDIRYGDRFTLENQVFEVLQLEPGYIDRVVAVAEAVD